MTHYHGQLWEPWPQGINVGHLWATGSWELNTEVTFQRPTEDWSDAGESTPLDTWTSGLFSRSPTNSSGVAELMFWKGCTPPSLLRLCKVLSSGNCVRSHSPLIANLNPIWKLKMGEALRSGEGSMGNEFHSHSFLVFRMSHHKHPPLESAPISPLIG